MKNLTVLLAFFSSVALLNFASAATTYPFVCKGPIRKASSKTYTDGMGAIYFEFNKHTGAGGVTGAVLPAGTCAWRDRAVSATESNVFYFDYNNKSSDAFAAKMVLDCLSTAGCSISVEAFANSIVNNAIYTSTSHSEVTRFQN